MRSVANLTRRDARELLAKITAPGFLEQDQWQAHIQALVLAKAGVYVVSDGLTDDEIRSCLLEPCRRIGDTTKVRNDLFL